MVCPAEFLIGMRTPMGHLEPAPRSAWPRPGSASAASPWSA